MKLNEKTVANFAVCSSPIDKEGYLHKRGELNKGFQRRWFVLKGNLMFYFEKKQDKEPLGVVVLENCSVQASSVEKNCFEIIFEGVGSRTYILQADNEDEMTSWMKSIAHASYEYIRTIVTELQRQLDSLTVDNQTLGGEGEDSKLISIDSPTSEAREPISKAAALVDSTNDVPPAIPKKKRSAATSGLNHSFHEYQEPPAWRLKEVGKSQSLSDDSAFLSGPKPSSSNDPNFVPPFPIPEGLELPQSPTSNPRSPSPSLDPTPVMNITSDHNSGVHPATNDLMMSASWEQQQQQHQQQQQQQSPRSRSKLVRPSDSPGSFYRMHQELGDALKVLNPIAAEKLPPLPPKPQS